MRLINRIVEYLISRKPADILYSQLALLAESRFTARTFSLLAGLFTWRSRRLLASDFSPPCPSRFHLYTERMRNNARATQKRPGNPPDPILARAAHLSSITVSLKYFSTTLPGHSRITIRCLPLATTVTINHDKLAK